MDINELVTEPIDKDDFVRTPLILQPGERKILPPRTYLLSELQIPSNASIQIISGGRNWLIFDVESNAEINGSIIYTQFYRLTSTIQTQAPDGEFLSHNFIYDNSGGRGGNGGNWQGRRGGQGARGTEDFGGGGGSGAIYYKLPRPADGENASGRYGAQGHMGGGRSSGGDGAKRPSITNGGLIYIRVGGTLIGQGIIDVHGEAGRNGQAGGSGSYGAPYGHGGGGGGGGGPGGNGGVVKIKSANNQSQLNVNTQGGSGGGGGPSGSNRGQSGYPGEDGPSGYIDYS